MKANREIRLAAGGCDVKLWQVAKALNISEYNLCRKMRVELPADEKAKILAIIKDLGRDESNG